MFATLFYSFVQGADLLTIFHVGTSFFLAQLQQILRSVTMMTIRIRYEKRTKGTVNLTKPGQRVYGTVGLEIFRGIVHMVKEERRN